MPRDYVAEEPREKWRLKECKGCGREFQCSRADALFCSDSCRQKTYDRLRREANRLIALEELRKKRAAKSGGRVKKGKRKK